jgi:hypothetical protein
MDRLSGASGGVGNLGGWLTTVTARVCLDMLPLYAIAITITVTSGKIAEIDIIADPDRLCQLDLAVLGD